MLEGALDRVALDVARGHEEGLALDADLEDQARVAQGQGQVVVRERDVLRLLALAVDDGGHQARAAGAASRALAEVRPRLGGDADLGHNFSSYVVARGRESRGQRLTPQFFCLWGAAPRGGAVGASAEGGRT